MRCHDCGGKRRLRRYNPDPYELSPEEIHMMRLQKQVEELARGGMGSLRIAKQLGISEAQVLKWIQHIIDERKTKSDQARQLARELHKELGDAAAVHRQFKKEGIEFSYGTVYRWVKNTLTEEEREQLRLQAERLAEGGLGARKIAKQLGVGRPQAIQWIQHIINEREVKRDQAKQRARELYPQSGNAHTVYKQLKEEGFKVSQTTVHEYVRYLSKDLLSPRRQELEQARQRAIELYKQLINASAVQKQLKKEGFKVTHQTVLYWVKDLSAPGRQERKQAKQRAQELYKQLRGYGAVYRQLKEEGFKVSRGTVRAYIIGDRSGGKRRRLRRYNPDPYELRPEEIRMMRLRRQVENFDRDQRALGSRKMNIMDIAKSLQISEKLSISKSSAYELVKKWLNRPIVSRSPRHTPEERETERLSALNDLIEMYSKGMNTRQIGEKLGIPLEYIQKWINRAKEEGLITKWVVWEGGTPQGPPRDAQRLNLALIVHHLTFNPGGWNIDDMLAELKIKPRTYRKYKMILREFFMPWIQEGESLLKEIETSNGQRWLRLETREKDIEQDDQPTAEAIRDAKRLWLTNRPGKPSKEVREKLAIAKSVLIKAKAPLAVLRAGGRSAREAWEAWERRQEKSAKKRAEFYSSQKPARYIPQGASGVLRENLPDSIALSLALIVHRLTFNPEGWNVDDMISELKIKPRTYRKYKKALEFFKPWMEEGILQEVQTLDGQRWLRLNLREQEGIYDPDTGEYTWHGFDPTGGGSYQSTMPPSPPHRYNPRLKKVQRKKKPAALLGENLVLDAPLEDIKENIIVVGPFGQKMSFFGFDPGTHMIYFLIDSDDREFVIDNIKHGKKGFPIFMLRRGIGAPGTLDQFWKHRSPVTKKLAAAGQFIDLPDKVIFTHIAMRRGWKRRKLGTIILNELKRRFPDKPVLFHDLTDQGRKFMEHHEGEEYTV